MTDDLQPDAAPLRILQIGAGSMGTRRLRDLSTDPRIELAVFDSREDRRRAAAQRFGAKCCESLADAWNWQPDAVVISTPPDQHETMIRTVIDRGLHHFCEAHIWTPDLNIIDRAQRDGLICISSQTMCLLPVLRELRRVVRDVLGPLHAYQMVLSTFHKHWHPGEGAEYYARHTHMSPVREMVPFELLWLNDIFGEPAAVTGDLTSANGDTGNAPATWHIQLHLDDTTAGQLMVLMASPAPVRAGWCFGRRGAVRFDVIAGTLHHYNADGHAGQVRHFGAMSAVLEATYAREVRTFIEVLRRNTSWPHTYRASAVATAALAAAELSSQTGRRQPVRLDTQPDPASSIYNLSSPALLENSDVT